ncbi:hybrid sensor histidine kinase/response regulator transcription factor [Fulvivirga sp. M361]|uniref:hybrid sensor histidine kinase/response regulator n=1 Tax=Fulvivirga sp. M361 TaxID=2594266 RepID=UPI0016249A4C|nr:hybrid sensor histidine kinase/response regulator transcription factor [Fulvivirga sp. M361]
MTVSSQGIQFERIGLEDGLSQISVMAITQDKYGAVWLGTRNGLNRYDGKQITAFKSTQSGNSLAENQIQKLDARDSLIWISTPNSISSFNLNNETLKSYPLFGISTFYVGLENVWVATKSTLYILNEQVGEFEKQEIKFRTGEFVKSMTMSSSGDLYLGTNMGVWKKNGRSTALITQENYQTMSLFIDSKENLWVGTNYSGLLKFRNDKLIKKYDEKDEISNDFVRCVEEDEEGKIWVGTYRGLDAIWPDGNITHYENDKSIATSISHNSIWSLFKDKDGAIWAGTYYGGANVFHPTQNIFTYFPENTKENRSVNFRVVGQVIEDADENLYICTDGGGLNFYDRKQGKFTYHVSKTDQNSISGNNVKSLFWHGDSLLWVGTHREGLNSFNVSSGEFKNFRITSEKINFATEIYYITGMDEDLLVASGSGCLLFNTKRKKFSPFLKPEHEELISSPVMSIRNVDNNEFWIGTERTGLFKYEKDKDILKNYQGDFGSTPEVPGDRIYAIFKDRQQKIWIGSSNGLALYMPKVDKFKVYTSDDGLPGNIVYGIVESRFSGLVVQTDKGISFYDQEKERFSSISYNNGLMLRELSPNGIFLARDGTFFVSGIEGMVSFHELDYIDFKPKSNPTITGLSINNEAVSPWSHSRILSNSIMETDNIELSREHSSITISISDMLFTKSNRQALEYQMKGFDDKWISAIDQSKITYTNLDDGTYTFRLRASNSPEHIRELEIVIRPPFYLASWAIAVYIFIAVILVILINYQYIKQSKLTYSLANEKELHQRDEELNQKKISFFTNISHEFRTPLTIMAGQIDLLLENGNLGHFTYRKLLNIQKNTLRLKSLISELLNFRKLEQGNLDLKVEEHDFITFIKEVHTSFEELASHSQIDYSLNSDFEQYLLFFDHNQLEKVFYNLLANAFKFTPEGGQIITNITEINSQLNISVINSGSTIPKEEMERVFDRFYQLDNITNAKSRGTGIGLALAKGVVDAHGGKITVNSSSQDSLTTFTVSLRKGKEHFKPEELHSSSVKRITIDKPMKSAQLNEFPERSETILIVEDNVEVMNFLIELIGPLFKVKQASNGLEAIEHVKENPPGLILSDVLMPKMNGTEMCAKLKADILTSHIPIILLTARGSDEHRIEGLETGADDYISKPFNSKVLIARINNILDNRQALQNKYGESPIRFARNLAKRKIDKEFLDKAHDLILTNIENTSYGVESFARDMSLGRTNLFRKIKGVTGQTPNEFITNIRLTKAAQLISTHPEISISSVAYSCGFSNPSYFSRAFKKKYDISPVDYRVKSQIQTT